MNKNETGKKSQDIEPFCSDNEENWDTELKDFICDRRSIFSEDGIKQWEYVFDKETRIGKVDDELSCLSQMIFGNLILRQLDVKYKNKDCSIKFSPGRRGIDCKYKNKDYSFGFDVMNNPQISHSIGRAIFESVICEDIKEEIEKKLVKKRLKNKKILFLNPSIRMKSHCG